MLEDKAEDVDVSVYDYVQYTFFCGILIPYVYPKSDGSDQDIDLLLDGLGMNNTLRSSSDSIYLVPSGKYENLMTFYSRN